MAVAKVIEISATSEESFEDAVKRGIERASQTVDDICGVWVKEQHVDVEDGKIVDYRVDLKVTFMLHEKSAG